MSEEQLTPKGAMREAKHITEIVGPKGETEDYQRAQDALEFIDSKARLKLLHHFFPKTIEQNAVSEVRLREERAKEEERREEIGPKGRIREDLETTFISEARSGRRGDYSMRVAMHLERDTVCLSSYSRIKDRFLTEIWRIAKPNTRNILTNLKGERFNFAMGKPREGEDELPSVFLIGTNKHFDALEAIELTDEYIESLSEEDLSILERASSEVARLEIVMPRVEAIDAAFEAS